MQLKIRPDVIKLTTPILIEQVFVNLLGIVNTILASRVSKEAVSAIGMVDSINSVVGAVLSALAIGATVVVAQVIARGEKNTASAATLQALVAGIAIGGALTLFMILGQETVLRTLYPDTEPEVLQYMQTYLTITALAYPVTALTVIGCGALRGIGETKSTMKVNMLMNVLNVTLSYVLIYGVQLNTVLLDVSIPAFGVAGAASALTLARVCGAIYLCSTVLRRKDFLPAITVRALRPNGKLLNAIFSVGLPASVESLVFNGGKLLVQVILVGMGTVAIASNYIAFSISSLINIPGAALAIASMTLVAYDAGRGDYDAARKTMWHVLRIGWVCMGIIGIVFIPLAPLAVGLYTDDAEVVYMASILVQMNCALLLCYPTTFILPHGLQGAGDVRFTVVSTLIGMGIFRLLLGYYVGVTLGLGVIGVWLAIIADWIARSALYVFRLRGTHWQHAPIKTD
jgi:putative MATE family efflux protein